MEGLDAASLAAKYKKQGLPLVRVAASASAVSSCRVACMLFEYEYKASMLGGGGHVGVSTEPGVASVESAPCGHRVLAIMLEFGGVA